VTGGDNYSINRVSGKRARLRLSGFGAAAFARLASEGWCLGLFTLCNMYTWIIQTLGWHAEP
jgi:hypothetical protein